MPLLLFLVFILVPICELYVLIQVGQAIGALPTIGLLILDSIVGAALMRSQGRAAWRRFNVALQEGRVPHREVLDGVLVIFGGALLLTPGFLTDIPGIILLLPPTRAIVRALLVKRFAGSIVSGAAQGAQARMGGMFGGFQTGAGRAGRRPRERFGDEDVVDAEATEVEPRRPELP